MTALDPTSNVDNLNGFDDVDETREGREERHCSDGLTVMQRGCNVFRVFLQLPGLLYLDI